MNQRIILIEKDFPLTDVEAKRLQRKYPFLTDNRIIEIRENNGNEELTGTVVDPVNKTLYPYSGRPLDFPIVYDGGRIWNYAKYIVPKHSSKRGVSREVLSKYFSNLTEAEIEELIYYYAFSPWAGAVVDTNPNVRDKKGEFIIFPYAYGIDKMMDLYPEAELFEWE